VSERRGRSSAPSRRGAEGKARKAVLRLIANGLFVLTARSAEGELGAATVSWVSQASFDPPLIMVALRRGSAVHDCLAEGGTATLHVLARDQQDVARAFFAGTTVEETRINGQPFQPGANGSPELEEVGNRISCRWQCTLPSGGDHDVVLLAVEAVQQGPAIEPLTVARSPWEYGG
jgi:flavin reductase (DIM6/NTAB) family NADH-FMN oxidoreductase RutF